MSIKHVVAFAVVVLLFGVGAYVVGGHHQDTTIEQAMERARQVFTAPCATIKDDWWCRELERCSWTGEGCVD